MLTLGARTPREHVNLSIVRIAGHLPTDPTRKRQWLGLLLELNFGDNEALEDPAIDVDVPDRVAVLNKKTLLLQSVMTTNCRKHPLGIRKRDSILKLGARKARPRALDRNRRGVFRYADPHLAVFVCGD